MPSVMIVGGAPPPPPVPFATFTGAISSPGSNQVNVGSGSVPSQTWVGRSITCRTTGILSPGTAVTTVVSSVLIFITPVSIGAGSGTFDIH